jgi:hypothetical protein
MVAHGHTREQPSPSKLLLTVYCTDPSNALIKAAAFVGFVHLGCTLAASHGAGLPEPIIRPRRRAVRGLEPLVKLLGAVHTVPSLRAVITTFHMHLVIGIRILERGVQMHCSDVNCTASVAGCEQDPGEEDVLQCRVGAVRAVRAASRDGQYYGK